MAERTAPRISINQLADYLTAPPARRRRIVEQQKYPATFMTNWYDIAQGAIAEFVLAGRDDTETLVSAIDGLYARQATSDYEETRFRTNAEAIEAFMECYEQLNWDDLNVAGGDDNPPKLTISGVEISVRPEFCLRGNYRGNGACGGIKLYFSKDRSLTDDSGPYVSAIVHRFMTEHPVANTEPTARHCQVLDVFGQRAFCAPTATSRRLRDVQAACEEIRLLWSVV